MKRHHAPRRTLPALLLLALVTSLPASRAHASAAPQREHLTPEEIEQVRVNQALDLRTGVFVKAVERRLAVIADPKAAEKLSAKELEQWGAVKGTRAQLLSDIERIVDEAVTNIEDAAIHSEKSSLIPKSVRRLAEAAKGFLPQLTALGTSTSDDSERGTVERVLENLQEIIEAAGKQPAEVKK
jgi:hypothetical protein